MFTALFLVTKTNLVVYKQDLGESLSEIRRTQNGFHNHNMFVFWSDQQVSENYKLEYLTSGLIKLIIKT